MVDETLPRLNLDLKFRKLPFYPLNYEAIIGRGGLLGALLDDLTTSVVTALRADVMIHHGRTAVGASCQSGDRSEVVSPSLVSSLLGDFVFRMCHN